MHKKQPTLYRLDSHRQESVRRLAYDVWHEREVARRRWKIQSKIQIRHQDSSVK